MTNVKGAQRAIGIAAGLGLAIICQSAIAHGGGVIIGNGGGSWVCRETSGTIRWSKLVDLFEATGEFSLVLNHYSGSTHEVVEQVKSRIAAASPSFFNALAPYIQDLNDLKSNPPAVTYITNIEQTIDDSFYRIKPAPSLCAGGTVAYEQVVNYKNDGFILVQSEIFSSFDSNVQAALILHEAIYKYRREVRLDTDSVATRRMVGLIFSTVSSDDLKKELDALGEREVGNLGMRFSPLQPGTFMLGAAGPRSDPNQHQVTLTQPFEMQKTTVTQSQYAQLMGINPSFFSKPEYCTKTYEVRNGVPMCPNNPVDSVSYDDVQAFIAKLNDMEKDGYVYRLPTEAEWEYAAKGGTTTAYYFGDDFYGKSGKLDEDYGWFDTNYDWHTHEVAQKIPNPYDLYDMLGNIAQWTSDWYADYQDGPATDPTGPSTGAYRVARPSGCPTMGGSWDPSFRQQYSAARSWKLPAAHSSCMGFRLVRVRRN